MIPTPSSTIVPDAPINAGPPDADRKGHLDGLIRAGVITHLVEVAESLDPLFAVAQMRDLPEVQFVAAFQDGLIALGCPGDLPEELRELAFPAIAKADDAEVRTMVDEGLRRIDRTAQKLEFLTDAMQPGDGVLAPVLEQLASIEAALSSQTQGDEGAPFVQAVAALNKRLDGIADAMRAVPGQAADDARLAEIEARLMSALGALSEKVETRPHPQIESQLAVIDKGLARLSERVATGIDADARTQKFDQFASVLGMVVSRIENSAREIKDALDPPETMSEKVDTLAATMKKIETQGHEIRAALAISDEPAPEDTLGSKIDDVLTRLDGIGAPDLGGMTGEIDRLHAAMAAVPRDIGALRDEVANLAAAPRQAPDLTELRRMMASFSSTVSGVVQRLENAVSEAGARDEGASESMAEVAAQIAQIGITLDALRTALPDLAPFETRLGELADRDSEAAAALAALQKQMSEIAEQPAPVLDLTAQRADFARFGTALSNIVRRVETVLDDTGGQDALTEQINGIAARLADLPDHGALQELWSAEVARLEAAMAKAGDRTGPALETLTSEIRELRERPDPIIDLTAQRQGFARFATALGATLARFDAIAEALEREDETGDRQAAEVVAVVQSLPELLENALHKVADLSPVTDAIGAVQRDIADLPDQLPLAHLSDAVTNLAKRPDPMLDLTAQRQSFARFGTAIATVIDRLDRIAQDLAVAGAAQPDIGPLADGMSRIDERIAQMSATQKSAISALEARIIAVAERAPLEAAEPQTPSAHPISLEDLRLQFAELIALQIRENAASFSPLSAASRQD